MLEVRAKHHQVTLSQPKIQEDFDYIQSLTNNNKNYLLYAMYKSGD